VAFIDPLNTQQVNVARWYFGADLIVGLGSRQAVLSAISRAERDLTGNSIAEVGESVIVAAVNPIIDDAIAGPASDLHLEPMRDRLRIRFRQDGAMVPHKDIPLDIATPLLSRIKVMAGANIAERRRHQDGRIDFKTARGVIDIRASFYVTIHGEKVVMRLL